MRLFIIGNGFDTAHGMKTKYEHFKKYLIEQYQLDEDMEEAPEVPDSYTLPDGGVGFDNEAVARLVAWMLIQVPGLGKEWNEFELALGELDYEQIMDEQSWILNDKNEFHEAHNYEDFSLEFALSVINIGSYFSDWIRTVKLASAPKLDMQALINNDSLALNFNYTETLESLYGMDRSNVCHIHGDRRKTRYLVIGHGKEEKRSFDKIHFAAQDNVERIHENLRKNTEECMRTQKLFFDRIGGNEQSSVDEIYSFGFSFEKVDLPYIEEICRRIDTSGIIWYQNDYDNKPELAWKRKQIKSCGFKGKFSTFHVGK